MGVFFASASIGSLSARSANGPKRFEVLTEGREALVFELRSVAILLASPSASWPLNLLRGSLRSPEARDKFQRVLREVDEKSEVWNTFASHVAKLEPFAAGGAGPLHGPFTALVHCVQ